MVFSSEEKQQLLAIRGVGPAVIERLQQLGFHSIDQLADAEATDITRQMTLLVGSGCWHNSPIAKACIADVIALAKQKAALKSCTSPIPQESNHSSKSTHSRHQSTASALQH